jgi:hypothetical protein
VRTGVSKEDYEKDSHALAPELADHPITADYVVAESDEPVRPRRIKVKSIIDDRCARCHSADKGGVPARFPLDAYDDVAVYTEKEKASGMSLTKLAQTTHAHLLSFSMLFGLTGLVFSLTSFPRWVRVLFSPFTLIAQLVDISCWWLARTDPIFVQVLMVTGGLVALGLCVHIAGSLCNLFGWTGKTILLVLLFGAAAGGMVLKDQVIDPYLVREQGSPELRDPSGRSPARDRSSPAPKADSSHVSDTKKLPDSHLER